MKKSSTAFTMVELVIIIVILGILASIAIPKLNANRDDALIAVEKVNYENCIKDLKNEYSSTGKLDIEALGSGLMTKGPRSCMAMKCVVIDIYNGGTSADFMVKTSPDAVNIPYCHTFIPLQFPHRGAVILTSVHQEKLEFLK